MSHYLACHETQHPSRRLAWGTLSEVFSMDEPLEEHSVRIVAKRVLVGLYALHRADMAHDDTKPANVALYSERFDSAVLTGFWAWLQPGTLSSCVPLSLTPRKWGLRILLLTRSSRKLLLSMRCTCSRVSRSGIALSSAVGTGAVW